MIYFTRNHFFLLKRSMCYYAHNKLVFISFNIQIWKFSFTEDESHKKKPSTLLMFCVLTSLSKVSKIFLGHEIPDMFVDEQRKHI